MTTNRKRVQSYLIEKDYKKLEEESKNKKITKSKYIEEAIKNYMNEKKENLQKK